MGLVLLDARSDSRVRSPLLIAAKVELGPPDSALTVATCGVMPAPGRRPEMVFLCLLSFFPKRKEVRMRESPINTWFERVSGRRI